jgi:hypothetical protein
MVTVLVSRVWVSPKYCPVMVIVVPLGPVAGEMELMTGDAVTVGVGVIVGVGVNSSSPELFSHPAKKKQAAISIMIAIMAMDLCFLVILSFLSFD